MKSVAVFGSINMDLTTYVPHLPKPGETLFGRSFITVPGGKGANQAVAAARLGAVVRMVGRVGDDAFGMEHLAALRMENIDVSGVAVDPENQTGLAVINVDDAGENAIIVVSGANMKLDAEDAARCRTALDDAQVLLLQLEIPLESVRAAASEARARGVTVVLDPAPARKLPVELFPLLDVLTPNEVEAEPLVGFPIRDVADARKAAAKLRALGAGAGIIKMGSRGAFIEADGISELIPAFNVDVVDTVAAGDAFNGGLAAALVEGRDLRQAVLWGAAAGALAVTQRGAMPSLPRRAALQDLLKETPGR